MIICPGVCTICIGKEKSMIRGIPGGRHFRIGSCESALARGPYPGLTDSNFSCAHGCRGGSVGLKVISLPLSIQTPVKSRAEAGFGAFATLTLSDTFSGAFSSSLSEVCAYAAGEQPIAHTSTAIAASGEMPLERFMRRNTLKLPPALFKFRSKFRILHRRVAREGGLRFVCHSESEPSVSGIS